MSGGIAYVYDPNGEFPDKCNMGLVGLESIETEEEKQAVFDYVREHVEYTNSDLGKQFLENWDERVKHFVKVMPHDYKRVLEEQAQEEAAAA